MIHAPTDPWGLALLVLAGSAGAVLRVAVSQRSPRGTLWVNVVGSLVAGAFLGWSLVLPDARLLAVVAIGFLGAFTTFSTWMVEVIDALQGRGEEGEPALPQAIRRTLLPVVLGVGAAALGLTTGLVLAEGLA